MAVNATFSESAFMKCEKAVQIRIYAELRSHVSVFNLTVELGKSLKCQSSVCTELNTITIETGDRSCRFQLQNVELLPSTCRGLQWRQSGELQLTLQVKDKQLNLQCEDQYGKACRKQEVLCDDIKACQNQCYCVGCGQKLLHDHSLFSRVLPLPSENWFDLAEFWFCHRHGDEEIRIPSVYPKPGDCLVSSLHVLIDWSHVKLGSVLTVGSDGLIKCSRCSNVLGFKLKEGHHQKNGVTKANSEKTTSTCQLYLHAVHFRKSTSLSPTSNGYLQTSVEVFLSELLQEQSRLYTCFRFLIQSQTSSHLHHQPVKMLLWLIDQDLTLYRGQCDLNQSTDTVSVNSCRVVKLLYRCRVGQADDSSASGRCDSFLYQTWEKDNTVHGLTLPHPLCLKLVSVLIQNTSQMPKSQRHLNGFHVSYLLKEGSSGKSG